MIALILLSEIAMPVSTADEMAFSAYRACVEKRAEAANLTLTDVLILSESRTACARQKTGALAEMTSADKASAAKSKEVRLTAQQRFEFMDIELAADVAANLVTRRGTK